MGAREVRAGGAYVEVSTKDSTASGLAGIKAKMASFGSSIARVGGMAISAGTAAAGAGAAAVMKAVDMGSTIKEMADRFGLSYQAVQQLGYAAEQSGASLESLIAGIKNMQKGLGNGTLGEALGKIGMSAAQLEGLAPDRQFLAIAEAIGRISDPSQRTAAAMAIFGKSATDLIPMLNGGKDGAAALVAEFDKMGVAMSDKAVVQAEKLGDDIDRLSKKFSAMGTAIGTTLMPAVEAVINKIDEVASPTVNEMANHNEGIAAELQRNPGLLMPGPTGWALDALFGDKGKAAADLKAKSDAHAKEVRERAMADVDVNNFVSDRNKAGQRSPIAEFLEEAQKRLTRFNSANEGRERGKVLDDVFGGVMREWDQIGRSVDRAQRKIKIRANREIDAEIDELLNRRGEITNSMKSFGSFDKRDLRGGVFQADPAELSELKAIRKAIEDNGKKKFALPTTG